MHEDLGTLFFFDTLKVMVYFLSAFSFLYVLIDYASPMQAVFIITTFADLKELSVFIPANCCGEAKCSPFAILVATIRVMTKLNVGNRVGGPFLAAGVSLKGF